MFFAFLLGIAVGYLVALHIGYDIKSIRFRNPIVFNKPKANEENTQQNRDQN